MTDPRAGGRYRSLLTIVALGILGWVAVLVGWEVSWVRKNELRDVEAATVERVVRDMTLLRATLDFALAAGVQEQVDRELTARGADPSLDALVLVDDEDRVLGARLRHHLGRPVEEVLGGPPPEDMMRAARTREVGSTRVEADGRHVVATYPVILGAAPGKLRADRVGVVVAVYSLDLARRQVGRRVARRAVELALGSSVATLALLVFGHFYIGRRVRALVRATERIAAGEFGPPASVPGTDELAVIGAALDAMAGRLGATLRHVAESEARFRTLVESAPVAILRIDAEGRVLAANPAWRALVGEDARTWAAAVHPDDRARVLRTWADAGAAGSAAAECRLVRQDGSVAWVHAQAVPEEDAGRAGPGLIVTVVDLTERRRAEDERARLEARLQQAQKLEALGKLASGVAHDFNNVLTGMAGHAELLAEVVAGQPAAERHVQRVLEAADRGRGIIREILEFGRPGVREPREIAVAPLVDEVARLLRPSLPPGVSLRVSVEPDLPPILGDPDQVHRVLVNLGTNAWQAMRPRGGVLELGARAVVVDAELAPTLPGLRMGPAVVLWVRDEGSGMDAATRARIFEPFFSTKPPGEGTGLGLAVVHAIVRAHGGAILVETEPGEGTTVSVHLPAAARGVAPPPPAAGDPRPSHPPRVLYVDDDDALLELAERAFGRAGFHATCHTLPALALAAFREDPGAYDLVVTDQHMPGMLGEELAREVLALRPDVPVLVVSGRVNPEDAARIRALGVGAVLEKPRSLADVVSAGRALLRAGP